GGVRVENVARRFHHGLALVQKVPVRELAAFRTARGTRGVDNCCGTVGDNGPATSFDVGIADGASRLLQLLQVATIDVVDVLDVGKLVAHGVQHGLVRIGFDEYGD